ncbi:Oidioi.mRNA.OKI2018_I69.chr2.g4040.t1.cds [Oikopleura dioica]|uniref:Oidioi.mRNA.OKI2018_I69.chr2.g4040.t1.cds n=1 Tax=Oikopleura dioica TaxID=34765 RepID=A0ABN7T0A7_OIKDI|nr:Oidioi.mRNA.OKI2018_I69.chr2.g4040.t1.cds [Oikopleura dioica]
MDFVKKLRSGEIQIDLVDSTDVYRLGDVYFRDAAKYTHADFEFELTKQVAKDTPWAFKNGVATKHMGSDDVQVILNGIKNVKWIEAKRRDWCLLTGSTAIVPLENMDFPEHHIMCVAEAKTFWKAPANPNA